eukprot:PhM_4_TR8157/c0_g1_i1/m.59016/K08489/STX16; syntaxin 16
MATRDRTTDFIAAKSEYIADLATAAADAATTNEHSHSSSRFRRQHQTNNNNNHHSAATVPVAVVVSQHHLQQKLIETQHAPHNVLMNEASRREKSVHAKLSKLHDLQRVSLSSAQSVFSKEDRMVVDGDEDTLPTDPTVAEQRAHTLSRDIKDEIRLVQRTIKDFTPQDRAGWGVQRTIATRWNTISDEFREAQTRYLTALSKRKSKEKAIRRRTTAANEEREKELDEESRRAELLSQGVAPADISCLIIQEAIARETNDEVQQVLQELGEIHSMFEEMRDLIAVQGTVLDEIHQGLCVTIDKMTDGRSELKQARVQQRKCVLM